MKKNINIIFVNQRFIENKFSMTNVKQKLRLAQMYLISELSAIFAIQDFNK